ncbi:PDZ domain-containing protein [Lysobacter korlensis]|uniref:endopeptidase La n=1 Tax=Lysobacter korlensis TaxID=553636 RepID=A0ABV6S0K5_9GAMM
MVLFLDTEPEAPPSTERRRRIGWLLLLIGLAAASVLALSPAPYVIEKPGPYYDTLGSVQFQGETVPLIEIPGEETYPTEGELTLLTVTIEGNPDRLPTWIDIALAWLQPSRTVVPVGVVYPPGSTVEDTTERSRIDMENSQREAIAAALTELDYEVPGHLLIAGTQEGGPSDGVLAEGDVVVSVNGDSFDDVTALREGIAANGTDQPAEVIVERDGEQETFQITPELSDGENPAPILGILVGAEYEFPIDVTIQLENVGGPSAGLMFALGIIDKLSPGALNGGEEVAGTGTITGTGNVGRIGGIRQKMYAALESGADWFLAPADNCPDVVGNVPDGLTVFPVATLDDAMEVLDAIRTDGGIEELATCEAG